MEFVSLIVKLSGAPIVDRLSEGKNLKRNYEKLNTDAQDLYNKREDIKEEITRGGEQKRTKRECHDWLEKVEELENQMKAIEEEYTTDKRWLWGWCPNVFWRMQLGKSIVEMMNQISDLKEKSRFEGGVVVDTNLSHDVVMAMPTPTIETATSADLTIQKIMECIKDEGIGKIGVWGMGGVGKTTIMKNLNNRKDMIEMFNIVIWVTVSRDSSPRKVQKEVAQRLSLPLVNDESMDAIAQRVFQSLKKRTFLLLLDDVWQKIDLDSIGIPNPNQEKGCKVVLTTRFLNVCHQMETNKEIQVNVLSKEESWRLFHEKAGEVVDSPKIEPIARIVVDECGGLPLAIIVVGASLRKVIDVHVWNNALTELRSPDASKIEDMEENVFRRLEYSYEGLGDDNVKKCFLYGALYPEDYEIGIFELIEHWREEGFIDVVGSLAKAHDKGHAILKVLKDASLFESGEGKKDSVKMHDVIRDLALRITSPKREYRKFLVRAGLGIEEAPEEEEWKHIERMSLMENNYDSFNLPNKPECSMLRTLFLQWNWGLKTIPESFFYHMPVLRVLDLSGTGIECLPPSICNLVNLVALYLNECRRLVGLPSQIGALKRLEVLNLDFPYENLPSPFMLFIPMINCLPTEIGELTHLKRLKVALRSAVRNNEGQTTIIPHGVLSRLSQLEELSIWFSPHPIDLLWDECVDVVEELGRLKQLINLRFSFPTVECLERFINSSLVWNNQLLTTFSFTVGYYEGSQEQSKIAFLKYISFGSKYKEDWKPYLEFICGNSIPHAIVKVLNRSKYFVLANHSAVGKLSEFGINNMSGLDHCMVFECNALETLIDGNGIVVGEEGALPKLETLYMKSLPNLRSIWEGPVPPGSLNFLKNLVLQNCPEASKILSRGMIKQLSNLENLEVVSCSGIKEIVKEDTVVEHHLLPKLKTLKLEHLKKLERICCKGVQLAVPSIERIEVNYCPELKNVFEGIVSLTSLRVLHMDGLRKVSKIFSREIIQQLSNLEELRVKYCPEIEEMAEVEMVEYHPLPKLKILILAFLPRLVTISCKRVPFGYPSLEIIGVHECPNLKRLPLGVHNTTTIKEIVGEREWWDALKWEDDVIKLQLQPLFVQW